MNVYQEHKKRPQSTLNQTHEFITSTAEVAQIKQLVGGLACQYDSFWVVRVNGQLTSVFGMYGRVVQRNKACYRLIP